MLCSARSFAPRWILAAGALVAFSSGSVATSAQSRTLKYVTTGNGLGFQVYDTDQKKIIQFLEHPYRFLRPRPGQPKADGIVRRNLAYDLFFGVNGPGGQGWLNSGSAVDPDYVEQTNVIRAPITLGSLSTESYFFAPFGYDGNALVAILHAPDATDGYVLLNFHMGAGESDPSADGESVQPLAQPNALVETGPGGGAMVYVGLSGLDKADCTGAYGKIGQGLSDKRECSGNDLSVGFQKSLADGNGWWAVGIQFVENPNDAAQAATNLSTWAANRPAKQMLDDYLKSFEEWRRPPPENIGFKNDSERKLWRQSETVLRMGQVLEPYSDTRKNHGMMLASLPKGEWHSGWVRDGIYAIVALARAGHGPEAKKALDFLMNAEPVGRFLNELNENTSGDSRIDKYRISVVRYFGTGMEDADYSGHPTPNVEVDGWGMTMWAARQYVDASGDTAWLSSTTSRDPSKSVYQVLAEEVAAPLEKYTEQVDSPPIKPGIIKKDSSIWEVHQENARHFSYTTLAAIRGFCDMAALARRAGKDADITKYSALARKATDGFRAAFVDQNNAFVGALEKGQTTTRADASVVEAFTWNIIRDYTEYKQYVKGTFDLLDTLQVPGGGYKRNDEGQSSYDNHEWILIDLRMSDAFRRAGMSDAFRTAGYTERADALLDAVVNKAAVNFHLLPELYSAVQKDAPIGSYWGSIPMVGYGAGAYILTLLDRAQMIEPNDCGTEAPPVVDGGAGGSGQGGSGQGAQNQGGQAGSTGCDPLLGCGAQGAQDNCLVPREPACLCRLEQASWLPSNWLGLLVFPAGFAVRRLARRTSTRLASGKTRE